MVDREEILKIIRQKGPVLPVQISKEFGMSILFASAMLSELVSAHLLRVSHVKIGGSPVYYLPEQSSRLQDFSKYLHQKEKEAYELLKQKKVLKDSEQDPPIKVALSNIKDYAWPLHVTIGNSKELFWKWYLTTNDEASSIIKEALGVTKQEHESKPAEKKEEKKETRMEEKLEEVQQKIIKPTRVKEETKKEIKTRKEPKEDFLGEILGYFTKNNIKVLNQEVIKRSSEIDFVIELQSVVGYLRYYCKAKSKKRVNDGDLSSAFVQGQLRKLPVLFLSHGEPTKRAKEMLIKEFKSIVFKKI